MAKSTRGAQANPQSAAMRQAPKPPAPLEPEAPTVRGARPIKVRATRMGYYDHARRREGDVFHIATMHDFSANWMELVDPATPERVTTAKQALEQQHDEILAGRTPGASQSETDAL